MEVKDLLNLERNDVTLVAEKNESENKTEESHTKVQISHVTS